MLDVYWHFGSVGEHYLGQIPENPIGILVCPSTYIVYHLKHLLEIVICHPGHDFSKQTLLQKPPLLTKLKKLVSTSPTVGVMTTDTPPKTSFTN